MTTTISALLGIGLGFFAQTIQPAQGPQRIAQAAPAANTASQNTSARDISAQKAAPKPASSSVPSAEELQNLIDKMQKLYEHSDSFSANFEQTYHNVAFGRNERSSGKILYKRPGMMRFDYSKPDAKSFIVDGKALWVVHPDEKQALVDRCFKSDALTSSLTFLFGQGDLRAQFDIRAAAKAPAGQMRLLLLPKKPQAAYKKLILDVDLQSGQVRSSTVVDPQGNINRFAFSKSLYNSKIKVRSFRYKAPKSFVVSSMPGSCRGQ